MKFLTVLALGALAYVVLKKDEPITSSGQLTPGQMQTAIATDPLGQTVASNILNAPDAAAALQLGNAALNGLDLTNPASVAVYTPNNLVPGAIALNYDPNAAQRAQLQAADAAQVAYLQSRDAQRAYWESYGFTVDGSGNLNLRQTSSLAATLPSNIIEQYHALGGVFI